MIAPPRQTGDENQLIALMIAYQAGDLAAFEQLYALLCDEVRRHFARNHRDRRAVDDLVQDLFLEIHRSRRSYAPPLPVRPWVYGIAHNVSARSRRAASQQPQPVGREEPGAFAEMPALVESPADSLDIEHALTALPSGTREAWLLHHVFGFTFGSIARRLGITVMAARLRSSRATRALKLALRPKRGSR
jgi:RNA polymerase sigma-70 factor (ECF subfamily)